MSDAGQGPPRQVHLICNAHLDPVWLWEREEGMAEALSTFRIAADFCDEFPGFVFNHNEAILYQWVESFDPDLFARIVEHVRCGRWHIMGGWYLQPDCNLPSGESFVRQMLSGRRYFSAKFGVDPTVAINFDPFGHSRGLVQLMAKAGYELYLFCRPGQKDCPLPEEEFHWVGHDGSTIMAARAMDGYRSERGKATEKIAACCAEAQHASTFVLWGIGNHGGGPSRVDLEAIRDLQEHSDDDILHSTPEAYAVELAKRRDALPPFERSLNSWAPGCYTSQARIKQTHRQLENALYLTEKMCSHATMTCDLSYPRKDLEAARDDLLYAQFHDILPGTSIAAVEASALAAMGHGLEILKRQRTRAFFALSRDQAKAESPQIPILVYNPHPFPVSTIIDTEFAMADQNWEGTFTDYRAYSGEAQLPTQIEREASNVAVDWRKRVVFAATLEPMRMNRFDLRPQELPRKPAPELQAADDCIHFHTAHLDIRINTRTGTLDHYRVEGREVLQPGALKPVVIKDSVDPWGSNVSSFRDTIGAFEPLIPEQGRELSGLDQPLPPFRVIEDGEVRTVVEGWYGYGNSHLIVRFLLPKHGAEVGLELRVLWNEKDRFLKLELPVPEANGILGQVACGVDRLFDDGRENVAQKWLAVTREDGTALTIINDGSYGSDYIDGVLRLSLLRSPAYAALTMEGFSRKSGVHTIPHDRYAPRSDQGERAFRFWLNAGPTDERRAQVDREALVHNERPPVLCYFPAGSGPTVKRGLELSNGVVQMQCLKQAEDGRGYIFRLFNPTNTAQAFTLTGPHGLNEPLTLSEYELATYRISADFGTLTEESILA